MRPNLCALPIFPLTCSILHIAATLTQSAAQFSAHSSISSSNVRTPPPEECYFLCECCQCSKPFLLTQSHSQVFFIFLPFSYLPGGGKKEKGRQAGTKDGMCTPFSVCFVGLPQCPWLPDLTPPLLHVFAHFLSSSKRRIISRTVVYLHRWLSSFFQIMAKSNNFFGTVPRAIVLTLYRPSSFIAFG